jgi:mono/diheme cytochrome c family protein
MDDRHVQSMKVVLLVSSLASLAILGYAAYNENLGGEWRSAQRTYRSLLQETAADDNARQAAQTFKVEHKQLYLQALGKIDRCTTCHLGVENPNMAEATQPLTTHPGNLLAHHPTEQFGCTTCHQGEGRAVDKVAAHGWHIQGTPVAHHESPLLRDQEVYTSCSTCHYEHDLYGESDDLFASNAQTRLVSSIDARQLSSALPGASDILEGKALMVRSGCLGCHQYRGRGGSLGPDVSYVGDKKVHDFDFGHIRGERTVAQWLFEHFMYPDEVTPGTVMPDMAYSEEEALALTRYMMSLHRKSAPASHRPHHSQPTERMVVRGSTLFDMFCSACHGQNGQGSTMRTGLWPLDADPWGHDWDVRNIVREEVNDLEIYVPSLNHPDTLAVASEQYLRNVIANGRPGTHMIGWKNDGGLSDDEITLLVDFIRNWQPVGAARGEVAAQRGDAHVGRALYRANCASCHGAGGEGGIGVSLNSPTFLAVASDEFLRDTIMHGRADTAMPAWREFDAQEISDIIAFMRNSWQPATADLAAAERLCASPDDATASADIGRILYNANCVMCHGAQGQGDLAPSINTQQFLTVVPDAYLLTTLIDGRAVTAMPSWRHMGNADLASIVKYMRTWQTAPPKTTAWHDEPVVLGDPELGAIHFISHCSGCHGLDGRGASGPQLSNPTFLKTATNRMLKEWITNGKEGTEMRPFRKGGHGVSELSARYVEDLVAYLRSLQYMSSDNIERIAKSPHGRPEKGAPLYAANCAACHGSRGEGASGPALSNPEFLRYASDGYLLATMALGRSGTEMRPVKSGPQSILELTSDEVNDVLALLRSWEHAAPFAHGTQVPHRFVVPWDLEQGRQLYVSNCSGCHGVEGKGSWAPELNNEGFLASATDGFLQATIVKGRKATAMRPFGKGSHGLTDMTADQIDNLVAYMRTWSSTTPSPMTIPAERSLQHGRSLGLESQPSNTHPQTTSAHASP